MGIRNPHWPGFTKLKCYPQGNGHAVSLRTFFGHRKDGLGRVDLIGFFAVKDNRGLGLE